MARDVAIRQRSQRKSTHRCDQTKGAKLAGPMGIDSSYHVRGQSFLSAGCFTARSRASSEPLHSWLPAPAPSPERRGGSLRERSSRNRWAEEPAQLGANWRAAVGGDNRDAAPAGQSGGGPRLRRAVPQEGSATPVQLPGGRGGWGWPGPPEGGGRRGGEREGKRRAWGGRLSSRS